AEYLDEPERGHNVLVTGLRGVGKTVLLNYYSELAEQRGWLVVEREGNATDSQPGVFRQALLEDLVRLAHGAAEGWCGAARGLDRWALARRERVVRGCGGETPRH